MKTTSLSNPSPSQNRLFLLTAIYSSIGFTTSVLYQLAWNIQPCNLCIVQRYLLMAVFAISAFGLFSPIKARAMFLARAAFGAMFVLATYHLFVQMQILTDPCAVPQQIASLKDFRALLTSPAPCSAISWTILGIPPPAYNAAFSLITIFCSFKT